MRLVSGLTAGPSRFSRTAHPAAPAAPNRACHAAQPQPHSIVTPVLPCRKASQKTRPSNRVSALVALAPCNLSRVKGRWSRGHMAAARLMTAAPRQSLQRPPAAFAKIHDSQSYSHSSTPLHSMPSTPTAWQLHPPIEHAVPKVVHTIELLVALLVGRRDVCV